MRVLNRNKPADRLSSALFLSLPGLCKSRQDKEKARSFPQLGLAPDLAAVALDNLLAGGEAQPRAVALVCVPGPVERLEYLL
jgi:hypothetical protein